MPPSSQTQNNLFSQLKVFYIGGGDETEISSTTGDNIFRRAKRLNKGHCHIFHPSSLKQGQIFIILKLIKKPLFRSSQGGDETEISSTTGG